jgi:hypothetical protein
LARLEKGKRTEQNAGRPAMFLFPLALNIMDNLTDKCLEQHSEKSGVNKATTTYLKKEVYSTFIVFPFACSFFLNVISNIPLL